MHGIAVPEIVQACAGVRLNVSSSGTSWSIGPRGATVNIGKRGAYLNAGLPGTGISTRIPLGRATSSTRVAAPSQAQPQPVTVSLTLKVDDDGIVQYLGPDDAPVSSDMITQARRQHGDTIRELLERKCSELNADISALTELHWYTPAPRRPEPFVPTAFERTLPIPPAPLVLSLADRLLPGRRRTAEAAHARQETSYRHVSAMYERDKAAHDARNTQERMEYSAAIAGNPEPMQRLLERRLGEIVWPKETLVAFDIEADGTALKLDVDLPEVEHMPAKRPMVNARNWALSMKEAGEQATRRLYQQHIHALGFRIIGEAFAALPTVQTIVFSGYSQRVDRASGHISEDYLYSVRIAREQWSTLNFDGLNQIDASDALARFEMRRNMTATGIFRPATPFD